MRFTEEQLRLAAKRVDQRLLAQLPDESDCLDYHFSEVFEKSKADAALAASLFHFRELTVEQVKEHLKEHEIPVRR